MIAIGSQDAGGAVLASGVEAEGCAMKCRPPVGKFTSEQPDDAIVLTITRIGSTIDDSTVGDTIRQIDFRW
jgi:hypothetical protein